MVVGGVVGGAHPTISFNPRRAMRQIDPLTDDFVYPG